MKVSLLNLALWSAIVVAALGLILIVAVPDVRGMARERLRTPAVNEAVRAELVAPSTAQIAWDSRSSTEWKGTVDAQNEFGAMIRKRVTVELDPAGQVRDVELWTPAKRL